MIRYKVVVTYTDNCKEYNIYEHYFNTLIETKYYLDSILDTKSFYYAQVILNNELIYSMNINGSISLGFD